MRKEHIGFELLVFDTKDELSEREQNLLEHAIKARSGAYAPYSKFQVGAAVLLENNEIVIGNNQENASYPSGLCAERVAVFQAGARYPGVAIQAVAISAATKAYKVKQPAAPCGNCRQSIAEYEQKQNRPIAILFQGEEGPIYKSDSIANILPLAFNNTFLSDS